MSYGGFSFIFFRDSVTENVTDTAMLGYALSVCKEKGMEKVILGCYKDNLASAATIQKNGGTLITENENDKEGRISHYYLIRL